MKTRLIIVRHAEAAGNFQRLFHGWTDGDITEKGHIQAKLAAERLKDVPIDVIYASSLKRTMQTAQYIAEIKGMSIIQSDKLWEINGGDWEDQKWSDLPKRWPELFETWEYKPHILQLPNGESMLGFRQRLIDEFNCIIQQNEGKNICIVTHGTGIKALLTHFKRVELEEMVKIPWFDNTAITILDFENEMYDFVLEGDCCHLDKECSTIENQEWWKDYKKTLKEIQDEGRETECE